MLSECKFLSKEWFDLVSDLATAAGDLRVPKALESMVMNLVVEMDAGDCELNIEHMVFSPGHNPKALFVLYLGEDLARKLFVNGDTESGLGAFMSGEMRVEGDVSKMMIPMTTQPSVEMLALGERIKELTI